MIFQQFNLVGRLSLFSNVALGSLGRIPFWQGLLGLWPPETKQAAMAALNRFGLADYAAQRANTLSGGQQQRGAIARALVQKAKIILADEPVASLDPVSARRVMEILQTLNREDGLTVIVTLHQVDYALRYCRRVVALKQGKIVYDGPARGPEDPATHRHLRPGIRGRVLGRSPYMIRRSLMIGCALGASLALVGCGKQQSTPPPAPSPANSCSPSCRPRTSSRWRRSGSRCSTTCRPPSG
jgi:ABC-type thiamine transport system ATPase subunit